MLMISEMPSLYCDDDRHVPDLINEQFNEQLQELTRLSRLTGNNVRTLREHITNSLRDITRILESLNR